MPFRLSVSCSILPNLRELLSYFQQSVFQEKGPRGFRRRSKSGRKRPGEGQRRRGVRGHRVSYFANRKIPRIDEAQFSTHVSCFEWRPFVLLPITSAGHGHLVPEGMLRQP